MSTVEPIRELICIKKIESFLLSQSMRDYLLFILGINSGLRVSDILNLDVRDVRGKDYIHLTEQKTNKAKKFPINKKLKTLLKKFTAKRSESEPLFKTIFNNRMDRTTAYRIITNACRMANLDINVGTHTMRKTFGYHHYKKFKDVAMLQMIFNHSNPVVTLRYIGISQDEIDDSYNNFEL